MTPARKAWNAEVRASWFRAIQFANAAAVEYGLEALPADHPARPTIEADIQLVRETASKGLLGRDMPALRLRFKQRSKECNRAAAGSSLRWLLYSTVRMLEMAKRRLMPGTIWNHCNFSGSIIQAYDAADHEEVSKLIGTVSFEELAERFPCWARSGQGYAPDLLPRLETFFVEHHRFFNAGLQ